MKPEGVPLNVREQLSDYIASRTGLDFPNARWQDLERGLASAMKELGFQDLMAGAEWLLTTPLTKTELDVVVSHLTIGETYFFREKKTFEVLKETVLPRLINARRITDRRLRIWSAACCTGEEPYSLAILLRELIPDIADWNVTILATDINVRFLKKATAAVYRDWSFRETPDWVKDRYFDRTSDGSYSIKPEIKRLVSFVQLNLVEDVFPSLTVETNAMDLIFCRNVLMYFSSAQAEKVVANLRRALVNDGWLVVSPSETSQKLFNQFVTVNFPGLILYRKGQKQTALQTTSVPEWSPIQFNTHDDFQSTSVLPSPPVSSVPVTDSKSFALLTRSLADQGKLTDALQWCDRWVHAEKLDALGHYLRAIVLQELGDVDQARVSFQKSIYLKPEFILSYFALGNLDRSQGRRAQAARQFANALRLLENLRQDDVLPESDGLTAGRLTEIISSINETS